MQVGRHSPSTAAQPSRQRNSSTDANAPSDELSTRPQRHLCAPCEPDELPDMGGQRCGPWFPVAGSLNNGGARDAGRGPNGLGPRALTTHPRRSL